MHATPNNPLPNEGNVWWMSKMRSWIIFHDDWYLMPLDFRYHLASLTAVLLFLLIGILVGVSMTKAKDLSEQVKKLREEFNTSKALREIDQRTDQFNERTQPLLVRNRLLNRNVALVCNGFVFPEGKVQAVRDTLRQAGATITADITIKPALMQLESKQVKELLQQLGVTPGQQPAVHDLSYRLGQDIGRGWTNIAALLQREKLIRVEGDTNIPISMIVYLGGTTVSMEDSLADIDLPFLRACTERELRVAATEPFEVTRSLVEDYQKVVPITIDNIDRAAGRIALVLALSSNRQGDFGYKSTADDVVPDTE